MIQNPCIFRCFLSLALVMQLLALPAPIFAQESISKTAVSKAAPTALNNESPELDEQEDEPIKPLWVRPGQVIELHLEQNIRPKYYHPKAQALRKNQTPKTDTAKMPSLF